MRMNAFVDEFVKIAAALNPESAKAGFSKIWPFMQHKAIPFARANASKMALIGLGGAGVLTAQRGIEDIRMAENFRSQMAARNQ